MKQRSALCILLVLCLLSCARQPQKGSDQLLVEIPELYNNDSLRAAYLYTEGVRVGSFSDNPLAALPYFERVLAIDSTHAPSHYQLSLAHTYRNPDKVYEHARKAYVADTTNLDYLEQYAYSLVGTGDYAKAKASYEKLLRLDPKNPANYRAAAILYAGTNMPHMAISILDSAEHKLGYIEELARYRRDLLIKLHQHDRAIEELQSVIANNPRNSEAHISLGEIYTNIGRDSLAEVSYRKALEVSPNNPQALAALGDHYYRRGRDAEFLGITKELFLSDDVELKRKLSIYDKIIKDEELYRKNFFAVNTLASILHVKYPAVYDIEERYAIHLIRGGKLDKSLEAFKRLAADPANPKRALYTVIDIEEHLGHKDSVLHYLDVAIARHPEDADLHLRKGYELLDSLGINNRKVVASFRKAIEVAADSTTKSNALGALADQLVESNPKKGFRLYRKALDYNPDNSLVLNNWAYFICEMGGNLQEALRMSTRACELDPTNANNLDTKAWILFKMGRTAEAKSAIKLAISLDTTSEPTFLLHYADILAAEGERFMAEIYYRRALDAGENATIIERKLQQLQQQP